MKKALLALSILLVLTAGFASLAVADSSGVYTVSGTYSAGTMVSDLSAPGQNFSFSFNLPVGPTSLMQDYVAGDDFYLNPINVNYTYDGSTTTLNGALLSFYNNNAGSQFGGFFVDYCSTDATCMTGLDYQWTFGGPQQYTGPESDPTLLPTNFSYNGQPFDILSDTNQICASTLSGSVTGNVVATPEPSALVLLIAGLSALALFLKVRG